MGPRGRFSSALTAKPAGLAFQGWTPGGLGTSKAGRTLTYVELPLIARHRLIGIFRGFPGESGASVAQLAEQLICNQQVVGSSPSASSYDFLYRSSFSWKEQMPWKSLRVE